MDTRKIGSDFSRGGLEDSRSYDDPDIEDISNEILTLETDGELAPPW